MQCGGARETNDYFFFGLNSSDYLLIDLHSHVFIS